MAIESIAELAKIAEDAYLFRYQNYTSLFITTDEGVILVDPIGQGNPRTPFMIKEAGPKLTDQPVKYVVYSHSTADHSTGGAAFADTAQFVGHRNAVVKMAAFNDPASPPPTVTFDTEHSVELGGKRLNLYPTNLSAQDDYAVVHYPAGKIVMTVDFVQPKNTPFRTLLGHPDRLVERLAWIADRLEFDTLVSGHATPQMTGTKEDVVEARQYLLDLSDAIGGAQEPSPEIEAAVRAALEPKYGAWRRFDEFLALNVEGMIRWRAS